MRRRRTATTVLGRLALLGILLVPLIVAIGTGVEHAGAVPPNLTYRVAATREGLVGGETSSGHIITPQDHFVALPACTTLSCDWLQPGVRHEQWGVRTECGTNCYVRVANPRTGACDVVPVLDVGPWFTLDDWWHPADRRNIPRRLARGETAEKHAYNGRDVGYGVRNGHGVSNKGYEVTFRTAIDLGDGTWTKIGYPMRAESGYDVLVTMLWQSRENRVTAARACR